ncbi:MAG: glycosyltransferase, partial [Clostridiales bacterium]|nr:glycosyltransferase [Clostridiales bacterium]
MQILLQKTFKGNSKILQLFSPQTLYKKYIKEHYDIIVSYLEGPTARIISGCTDKDTKLVSWIHSKIDNAKVASASFRNFNEAKKCYDRFDNTVCVSRLVKRFFKNTLNFEKPLEVLYNTIEAKDILKQSGEEVDDLFFDKSCIN